MKHVLMEAAGDEGAAAEGLMADHRASGEEGATDTSQESVAPLHTYEERPEFLPETFFDPETKTVRLEALVKSQTDYRQKARENDEAKDVPEDINDYIPIHGDNVAFDKDDPVIIASREAAKKHGISKEAYTGIMSEVIGALDAANGEAELSVQAERELLGPNHERILSDLSDNLDSMVNIGLFGEDDFDAAISVTSTAAGIKMLNKIFNHYQQTPNIPMNTAVPEGALSKDELDAMVGTDEYNNNHVVRAKVKAGYERLYKN